MTGPDINRPRYGSNAIGSFIIGTSPIGSIPFFDYWTTVLSQYANSPILMQLVDNFFQYVDPTKNIDAFFDLVFNVNTAQGYGLDVWGRIVGVNRTLQVSAVNYFGFSQQGITVTGFSQATFYSGSILTNNFQLSDASFKVLIFAKALTNISNGSIPSINQILLNLFPNRGNCYVTDNNNMTLTYNFNFTLSAVEIAILTSSGVLPKPVGVAAAITHI